MEILDIHGVSEMHGKWYSVCKTFVLFNLSLTFLYSLLPSLNKSTSIKFFLPQNSL